MGTKERMKLKDTIVLLNEDMPPLTGASTLKRDKLIIKIKLSYFIISIIQALKAFLYGAVNFIIFHIFAF